MRVEESSVIRRAQTGDQRAFQQLVETHHALVWRTARALLGDAAAAEEVEQEAWLDVWRGLPAFQVDRPFHPWLLTVVVNRSRKHARRQVVVAEPLDESAPENVASPVMASRMCSSASSAENWRASSHPCQPSKRASWPCAISPISVARRSRL
jgi:RNA polymerase sigma factor (sigma-70 family)